jgi:hypothetical protein
LAMVEIKLFQLDTDLSANGVTVFKAVDLPFPRQQCKNFVHCTNRRQFA